MFSRRQLVIAMMLLASVSSLCARADNQLKVSPADELLIVDPRVDSQKRPTPVFLESDGGTQIQMPPTAIVHRYYYSGDRDFQGPMLPGGPSVIVANHPITGEQVSLHANLMPGAPRIKYTKQAIIYDYGDRSIALDFGVAAFCKPKIVYHRDTGLRTRLSQARQRSLGVLTGFVSRAGIPDSIQHWRTKRSDAVLAFGDRIGDAKNLASENTEAVLDRTPFGGLLTPRSVPEAAALGRATQTGIVQELSNTIPTNR